MVPGIQSGSIEIPASLVSISSLASSASISLSVKLCDPVANSNRLKAVQFILSMAFILSRNRNTPERQSRGTTSWRRQYTLMAAFHSSLTFSSGVKTGGGAKA